LGEVVALILLAIVLPFGIGAVIGAPYVPVLRRDSRRVLELLDLKPGQTLVDLGSGDGRLLRAAAARGIRCIGYEINPYLVWVSRLVCLRYRRLVTIHTADFWRTKLPPADAVYVFMLDRYMTRLDQKLAHEAIRPLRLVSYAFDIPGRTPTKRTHNTFVYEYKPKKPAPDLKS
jgi:SAM-dependent methyltransferase